jgi:hypothetical protein
MLTELLHTLVWTFLAAGIVTLPHCGNVASIPLGCDPDRARFSG